MLCSHALLFPPLDWLQEQGPTLSLHKADNLHGPLQSLLQHVLKVYLGTLSVLSAGPQNPQWCKELSHDKDIGIQSSICSSALVFKH